MLKWNLLNIFLSLRSANQVKFAPSNSNPAQAFHDWSQTGGAGQRQPDNREGGESCMAVLNNFYQVWNSSKSYWINIYCLLES